jgi:hypothetical protein
MFMKLFSSADSTCKGKAYVDAAKNRTIQQPCACLYGTTTHEHFYSSLSRETMSDGFVARLLIFESEGTPPKQRPRSTAIPESIIEQAKWWADYRPTAGNLNEFCPAPTIVKATDEAVKVFEEFSESFDLDKVQNGSEVDSSIWGRASEKAGRLALIRAVSRDTKTLEINAEDAVWATALVRYLTELLMFNASQYISENALDDQQMRVIRMIRDAGGSISKAKLCRSTRSLKKREREELIDNMIETGAIVTRLT